MLNVATLNVVMLNVVMLNVVILSVVMLSVVASLFCFCFSVNVLLLDKYLHFRLKDSSGAYPEKLFTDVPY